jgi:hypothetical protein
MVKPYTASVLNFMSKEADSDMCDLYTYSDIRSWASSLSELAASLQRHPAGETFSLLVSFQSIILPRSPSFSPLAPITY